MTHEYLLWICTTAYAMHVMEEHTYDWRDWARTVLHLPVDWPTFYVTNGAVIVLGVSCAGIGWQLPEVSLALPALMVINAIFFHAAPTIAKRVFSPGLLSALILMLPVAWWTYRGAYQDGALTTRAIVVSTIVAALLMAYPIALLKTRDRLVPKP